MLATNDMNIRVREAILGVWNQLPEDEVARVGDSVDRLAVLLHEHYGLEKGFARCHALATFATAVPATHTANAGWAEILRSQDSEPIARGQVLIHDVSPDSEGHDLYGALQHVRTAEGPAVLESGRYVLRFEANGEARQVVAVSSGPLDDARPIGIAFMDDGLPISVLELSAGE